jgi:hypothetical protein
LRVSEVFSAGAREEVAELDDPLEGVAADGVELDAPPAMLDPAELPPPIEPADIIGVGMWLEVAASPVLPACPAVDDTEGD